MADPKTHALFLDYRDRHVYFGGKKEPMDYAAFEALYAEYAALLGKGEARDDEEEARFAELAAVLHRD